MTTQDRVNIKRKALRYDLLTDICSFIWKFVKVGAVTAAALILWGCK